MKIIVGNWKMQGDAAMAHPLVESVAKCADARPDVTTVICPPATLLAQVASWLVGANVKTGGQDCHGEAAGAFTGDISAAMLADAGCSYVIVGHSERRQFHHEKNADVQRKAARAIASNLIPIICIGETEAQRAAGKAEEVVGGQLTESLPDKGHFLLAYEPVWAIGSGKTPTADDIRRMHAYIKTAAAKRTGLAPERVSVLYGGSVKAGNAAAIMAISSVDGVLVGGASVKAEEFCKIIGGS